MSSSRFFSHVRRSFFFLPVLLRAFDLVALAAADLAAFDDDFFLFFVLEERTAACSRAGEVFFLDLVIDMQR